MFNYGMCNHGLKMRRGTNEAYFAAVRLKQLRETPFQLGNSRPPSIRYRPMTGQGSILTLAHALQNREETFEEIKAARQQGINGQPTG